MTINAGSEDGQVKQDEGLAGMRQGRILRALDEALKQGGVRGGVVDLARVLHVDVRPIRQDIRILKVAGHLVHTRGRLKGVGRGQTHKVRIIKLWLDREGYDKIARWVHHTPQAIQHYVGVFLRMVTLHEKGTSLEEIAFLTKTSSRLVRDYLEVYSCARQVAHRREKLQEELERVQTWQKTASTVSKKGGQSA